VSLQLDTRTVCGPLFPLPPSPFQSSFQADLFSSAAGVPLRSQPTVHLVSRSTVQSIPPELSRPLQPVAPAGLHVLHPSTMRFLLESSWMKFGPAGRDSLDWSPGPSALPSTDRQAPSIQSHRHSGEAIISARSIAYITIATVSFLLLLLFSVLGFLIWRRRHGLGLGGKLGLANVIALEDLQDPERNCELLSSIRRSRGGQHRRPSSSSEQDATDGVFLMVYLPSPYEQTLTRIARAASTSSSNKDLDLLPP
ncbi:hypothetical protein FQN60_014672, partial [Etheostoma spectabile]